MPNNRHSFIAFYPSDWAGGTVNMSRLQRSVYFDICQHCWDHATECPAAKLALLLGDIPDWHAVVDQLVTLGKIYRTETGDVGNARAILEGKKSLKIWSNKRKGGRNRWKSKRLLKNKTPIGVHEESSSTPYENHNHNHNQKESENLPSLPSLGSTLAQFKTTHGIGNGNGLRTGAAVTITDPDERLRRFQKSLADAFGSDGWHVIAAATDDTNPGHDAALAACQHVAHTLGKGWPTNWPTDERY